MIHFGNRIEPFVDSYLIETKENLTFRPHPPKDCGQVIPFAQPWEGYGSLGMTVFEDEKEIKLYYRGYPSIVKKEDEFQTSCLSVSQDGVHFTPYPVNEIDYKGIRENNIVYMNVYCHNFAPFYDTNPNCKPDERYKAIGGKGEQGGIHVFGSPDGVHWHPLHDGPVITKGAFDSMNMAFWNPATGRYHCYYRYFHVLAPEKGPKLPQYHEEAGVVRAIQSVTSEDFIHWTDPVQNQYEEGYPKDELYTNATRPLPGAEHILLSVPMRFHAYRKKIREFNHYWDAAGVSDAVLMTSRDGIHWDRSVKDAWISGDICDHEWTQRNFITAGGIIERGNSFYFYVEKRYMWDDGGIWLYSVPKYRLISLYADGNGGSFTSKPLHFETDTIALNYATSAYGFLRVTVLDMDGQTLYTSEDLYGNELSDVLRIEGLAGREGRLLIEMREANLYAIGAPMTASQNSPV